MGERHESDDDDVVLTGEEYDPGEKFDVEILNPVCPVPFPTPPDPVASLFRLFATRGHDAYHGEPVTQTVHALQCAWAALLCVSCTYDLFNSDGPEERRRFVAAALCHDVGHMLRPGDLAATSGIEYMGELGVRDHERVGAEYLARLGFHPSMCELVRDHVRAKRYLVWKSAGDYALSDASRQTLALQGGPMSAEEATEFERDPLHKQKIELRRLDECAKKTDYVVAHMDAVMLLCDGLPSSHVTIASLANYRPLLESVLVPKSL